MLYFVSNAAETELPRSLRSSIAKGHSIHLQITTSQIVLDLCFNLDA